MKTWAMFIFYLSVMVPLSSTALANPLMAASPGSGSGGNNNIKLAIDERNWYPFTFEEKGNARGMHVDLVRKALENLGYSMSIDYLPRRRCLFSIENGSIDAMISISYNHDLSKTMLFPDDASDSGESEWRIMQVDHVVVTMKNGYEFDGTIKNLPEPVRIPAGESITEQIAASGRMIDEAKTDEQNFAKMLRDMSGCVITTTMIAEKTMAQPQYAGKLNIHATPIASHSYHLGFSKKTSISDSERLRIWKEIKKLRDDYVFMLQLYSVY